MSYLELLKLAAPETIVVVTALAVLTVGLTSTRAKGLCPIIAVVGIVIAIAALLMLPQHANLFGGMLVISPLNSLFKIICLVLALVTVPLASSEKSLRNSGEYLAVLLNSNEVRWHRLIANDYQVLPADADGVIRSRVFPGLWLQVDALLADDMPKVLETLQRGLPSPEHAEFVELLKRRRS